MSNDKSFPNTNLIPRTTQEKILLWLSAISASALLPFAIVRLSTGDINIAIVDGIGFFANLGLIYSVYRYRRTVLAGFILSAIALGGIVLNIYIEGPSEVYFMYPVVIAAYFLTSPILALGAILVAMIALLPVLTDQMDWLTLAKFYSSLFGCVVFTYVFASLRNRQRDQLLEFARKDALTGAGNRRAMDQTLLESVLRFGRTKSPMSLIVFDLDKFKEINDTHGHDIGDQVLVRLTHIVHNRIRITDQLFRYGGDEFTVLASDADLETAAQLAEDLRLLVDSDNFESRVAMSISLGVAEYRNDENVEAWMKRADDALRESKRLGRNCVVRG